MSIPDKKARIFPALLLLVSVPLFIWGFGDFPRRSVLKEGISILTLVVFFLMLGQFFLTRSSQFATNGLKRSQTIKIHKYLGYVVVSVALVHPFLIVFPRYFESGVAPGDAFVMLITAFQSSGVVTGMVAWCLVLILGLSALFRKKLPMRVKTWRLFHGILSILFMAMASWHVIDLGRHAGLAMSFCIIVLAAGGILLLLATYWKKELKAGTGQLKGVQRKPENHHLPEWGTSK